MTNEAIILNERIRLYEAGKIGGTGRKMEIQMEAGSTKTIEEPEQIHSFLRWKEYGFSVRKGEKAVTKLEIWKHVTQKKKEETADGDETADRERMFKKETCFFTGAQVEPRKERKQHDGTKI